MELKQAFNELKAKSSSSLSRAGAESLESSSGPSNAHELERQMMMAI